MRIHERMRLLSPQVKTYGYDEKSPLKGLLRCEYISPLCSKNGEGILFSLCVLCVLCGEI
jgi:hypothetical protein